MSHSSPGSGCPSLKGGKMTGGWTRAAFGETLCLPIGWQGGTFSSLTEEPKYLVSELAPPKARLTIRLKTRHAGVRRRPHGSGRRPCLNAHKFREIEVDRFYGYKRT
jgi:hypothetical protein